MKEGIVTVFLEENLSYEVMLKKIERTGRIAFRSEDKITDDSAEKFIKNLIKRKHFSVLEHCSITIVARIDRGISHELVRHRLCSYTHESTRYCNYNEKELEFSYPMNISEEQKNKIKEIYETFEMFYKDLIQEGMQPQQARDILPIGTMSTIAMTANIRQWREILEKRYLGTTGKPHPKMQHLMHKIYELFIENYPIFFSELE